eukprot:gb/GECG01011240.1/.p1 GENE.gb/GECG01011240.1/~~gb/GECG01011240.1/.p1  ORF type:complete len:158 (+),score=15.11 gb/GECG01011240.1/:1-474(+)
MTVTKHKSVLQAARVGRKWFHQLEGERECLRLRENSLASKDDSLFAMMKREKSRMLANIPFSDPVLSVSTSSANPGSATQLPTGIGGARRAASKRSPNKKISPESGPKSPSRSVTKPSTLVTSATQSSTPMNSPQRHSASPTGRSESAFPFARAAST